MSAPVFNWKSYAHANVREHVLRAREDVNAFIEYVGDGSGSRIYQEEAHREWQANMDYHKFLVLHGPIGSGKTVQVRGRLLYEIGRDPDSTFVAYISASQDHPKKQSSAMMEMIDRSDELHHVYPHLRKRRDKWSPSSFKVERKSMAAEPTMQVYGIYGNILGARKNRIVIDDLCTFINTLTATSREKTMGWLSSVLSRLKGEVSVICLGHIWHDEDALMQLVKTRGFTYLRYEATTTTPDGREVPTFPRVLPAEKIKELYILNGPIHGEMMLYNRMPKSTTSRFAAQWMENALVQGRGTGYWPYRLRPCEIVTGVDLGHQKKPGKDLTVMVTVALEEVDGRQKRRVIDVRAGHWKGPEIVREMQALRELFQTQFFVENNGGQQYVADFAEDDAILPVPCYASATTGTGSQGKYDLKNGVEGALGGELKLGMWIFPCDEDDTPPDGVAEMIRGAHAYHPTATDEHTSDYLMAWWYAWKGAQMIRPRRGPPADNTADPLRR